MAAKAVRAVLTLHLEDGSTVTYRVSAPDGVSVRGREVPVRDENYGRPVNGRHPRHFTVSFGWPARRR